MANKFTSVAVAQVIVDVIYVLFNNVFRARVENLEFQENDFVLKFGVLLVQLKARAFH